VKTKDSEDFFSLYKYLGTTSHERDDGIFKVQYRRTSDYTDVADQQYDMNGMTRFKTLEGVWVIAASFYTHGEVVIFKDPYTYSSADGGGQILQRFGSPYHWTGTVENGTHIFGLSTSEPSFLELHNVYHTVYSETRETITVFVNKQNGINSSMVFEFDVLLVSEDDSVTYDDSVFDTAYIKAPVYYQEDTWGGARPVGVGLWLVGRDDILAVSQHSPLSGPPVLQRGESDTATPATDAPSAVYDSFTFFRVEQ